MLQLAASIQMENDPPKKENSEPEGESSTNAQAALDEVQITLPEGMQIKSNKRHDDGDQNQNGDG